MQILLGHDLRFDLKLWLALAEKGLPKRGEAQGQCLEFIVARLRALLLAQGNRYDIVDAVLAAQGHDPAGSAMGVQELARWTERDDWPAILQAYARCARILRGQAGHLDLDPAIFSESEERKLHQEHNKAEAVDRSPGSVADFLGAFEPMIPAITAFFDDVLVMSEDTAVRANRLAMLQRIVALADGVVDLSHLESF